ncbi:hypothetical protein F5Y15DRAFT_399458 [Xylariaceae sp. FL0016]|nr:hypothetical protein F5Y15DRAFT_399458 [Xylariaceae sp. FL0016]
MPNGKVAIITGGASGIGHAVAQLLSQKGWTIHILDIARDPGEAVAAKLSNTTFREVDITSYPSLSAAFDAAFKTAGRVDFVFANAGVIEKPGFYAPVTSLPPPLYDELCLDTNIRGILRTAYLAQHYFRANPRGGRDCVLILTCSVAGLYAQDFVPLYSAAKAGVLNFARSIAAPMYESDGVRTYAICPGSVRTGLLPKEAWDAYPQEYLTAMQKVTDTVEALVEGKRLEDSNGKVAEEGKHNGLMVEIFVDDVYFREPLEPCNDGMKYVQGFLTESRRSASKGD